MSEDKRIKKPRMQSQIDRDAEGYAAKKERELRERESRERDSLDGFDGEEDITGRYEGSALAKYRARRPIEDRIGRLELKQDNLDDKVDRHADESRKKHDKMADEFKQVSVKMGEVSGKLDVLPNLVTVVEKLATRADERADVRLKAQVDNDAKQIDDVIDGRRLRRRTIAKVVGAIFGGALGLEILRRLLGAG